MTRAPMAKQFSSQERDLMLGVKYVGPSVIKRLEELGLADLESLAQEQTQTVCHRVSAMLGSSCWANSHQARQAISGVIALAVARSSSGSSSGANSGAQHLQAKSGDGHAAGDGAL